MGAVLAERSELARRLFDEASQILGFDLLKLCTNGPQEELNRTEFSQPALYVHSYAALKQAEQDRDDFWDDVTSVAGLSLGEYTAVASVGGLSFADGVRLVQERGKAMQAAADAVESGMSSVLGLEKSQIETACAQASDASTFVRVANLLCPGNIAISGHIPALERAEQLCQEAGAMRTIRLQVAGAFHTPIMQLAVERLEKALAAVEFHQMRLPVVSNVDAQAHSQPDEFKKLLPSQVVSPVYWEDSLRAMLDSGVDRFIEIGTGRVLAGTLKRVNRKIPCENLGD